MLVCRPKSMPMTPHVRHYVNALDWEQQDPVLAAGDWCLLSMQSIKSIKPLWNGAPVGAKHLPLDVELVEAAGCGEGDLGHSGVCFL